MLYKEGTSAVVPDIRQLDWYAHIEIGVALGAEDCWKKVLLFFP